MLTQRMRFQLLQIKEFIFIYKWNLSLLFQFDPRRFFQVRNSSVAKFQMLFVFRFSRRFRVECLYYCWKMQNVINAVKGTALNVAEKFTPVLKVGIVQQIVRSWHLLLIEAFDKLTRSLVIQWWQLLCHSNHYTLFQHSTNIVYEWLKAQTHIYDYLMTLKWYYQRHK